MKELKLYQIPALRIVRITGELNFLATGSGEDADPKTGTWLYDDEI